jgi:dipeptidase E
VLSLGRRERPRVCFVATASSDSPEYVANFYRAFSGHHDCEPSDLGLFNRTVADLRAFVLAQDVVYVGGGNTASLLAVWCMHGLDVVLREAWEDGIVLCGSSAGMNCWFEASTTDSCAPAPVEAHDASSTSARWRSFRPLARRRAP